MLVNGHEYVPFNEFKIHDSNYDSVDDAHMEASTIVRARLILFTSNIR